MGKSCKTYPGMVSITVADREMKEEKILLGMAPPPTGLPKQDRGHGI